MFAIFQTGGKQYKVKEGDFIFVEKLDSNVGDTIEFKEILMAGSKFGKPFVQGAVVKAKVIKHGKNKKIRIIKFKSKKHHMKKQGHRQPYTKLSIESIKA